jgi:hypothetical protein
MITVEYYPAGEKSPLPNGDATHSFETFDDFKAWVQSYVCIHCLVDFYEFSNGKVPTTLEHWLDMGCGCEIGVGDPNNMIDWDSQMELPNNFMELVKCPIIPKN